MAMSRMNMNRENWKFRLSMLLIVLIVVPLIIADSIYDIDVTPDVTPDVSSAGDVSSTSGTTSGDLESINKKVTAQEDITSDLGMESGQASGQNVQVVRGERAKNTQIIFGDGGSVTINGRVYSGFKSVTVNGGVRFILEMRIMLVLICRIRISFLEN